jgi:hypothetical protein
VSSRRNNRKLKSKNGGPPCFLWEGVEKHAISIKEECGKPLFYKGEGCGFTKCSQCPHKIEKGNALEKGIPRNFLHHVHPHENPPHHERAI